MKNLRWAVVMVPFALIAGGCADSGSGDGVGPASTPKISSEGTGSGASSQVDESSATTPPEATTETTTAETPSAGDAEPWGDLRGQFLFAGGSVPPRAKLSITKDQDYCGTFGLTDESVVVNPDNNGLANVFVYLYPKRGEDVPIHPSYEESAAARVSLDNEHCRFAPHVCLLRTSQTLVVGNKDTVGHNTKVDTVNNSPINPITPAGDSFEHQFEAEERAPMSVGCSIHPWMNGWLLIRDNPYFAVSDEDGNFEIKNLPAGEWTIQVWQEKAKGITEATVNGESVSWSRGRMPVTISAGQVNDLGKIEVPSSAFE